MKKVAIIITIIVIVIIAAISYGVYRRNYQHSAPSTSDEDKKLSKNAKIWIAIALILIIAAAIAYIYFTRIKPNQKIPTVPPDEANNIFKERLITKGLVNGFYDKTGNLHFFEDDQVKITDQHQWTYPGTTQKFMSVTYEIKTANNDTANTQTFVVNLNEEKKMIQQGMYTYHNNVHWLDWVKRWSYLKKLPMATPESELLQMAQYAADNDVNLEELQRMKAINESKRRDDRGRFAQDDTTEEDEEVPALPKSQQEKRYRWDNRRQKYGYR